MVRLLSRLDQNRGDVAQSSTHIDVHLGGTDFGKNLTQTPVQIVGCLRRRKKQGSLSGSLRESPRLRPSSAARPGSEWIEQKPSGVGRALQGSPDLVSALHVVTLIGFLQTRYGSQTANSDCPMGATQRAGCFKPENTGREQRNRQCSCTRRGYCRKVERS